MGFQVGIGYDIHRQAAGPPAGAGRGDHPERLGARGAQRRGRAAATPSATRCWARRRWATWGRHFPPGDPRWKDVPSLELLRLIRALLAGRGATIVNVDATLVAEAPRIAPLREAMCLNISQALRIGAGQISVKATTNETLGAIGRGEGVAAVAIAMVEVA